VGSVALLVIREDGSRIRPRISFEKDVKAQQRVAIALQTVAYRVLSVRFERLSPKRRQSPDFMARSVLKSSIVPAAASSSGLGVLLGKRCGFKATVATPPRQPSADGTSGRPAGTWACTAVSAAPDGGLERGSLLPASPAPKLFLYL
jgi:hypothetical protein